MNWIFVFESEGGGTEFHPIKTKCVNINFKKFFMRKTQYQQNWEFTFWSDDRYLDIQNINKKNHKFGLIIYNDLKI